MYVNLKKAVKSKAKGEFARVTYEKELKTLRQFQGTSIRKVTNVVGRFGVQYDNMKAVKVGRATGEKPEENAGLQWGQWSEYPYFIEHKGQEYLRISLVNGNKPQSKYFMNGQEVTAEEVKQYCLASEFRSSGSAPEVLTIKVENIMEII